MGDQKSQFNKRVPNAIAKCLILSAIRGSISGEVPLNDGRFVETKFLDRLCGCTAPNQLKRKECPPVMIFTKQKTNLIWVNWQIGLFQKYLISVVGHVALATSLQRKEPLLT